MSEEKATYEVGCYYCEEWGRFSVIDTDLKMIVPENQICFCPLCGRQLRARSLKEIK